MAIVALKTSFVTKWAENNGMKKLRYQVVVRSPKLKQEVTKAMARVASAGQLSKIESVSIFTSIYPYNRGCLANSFSS